MGTAPRGEFDPAQGVHRDDELEFILRMLPSGSFAQCGPTGRSWPALSLGSGRRTLPEPIFAVALTDDSRRVK